MTINEFNFAGKKAIVRVDFNVPLDENGKITDDTRIRGALPTLKKILADGGAVIIMSHMGKPKGKVNPKLSLSQIVKPVSEALLGIKPQFDGLLVEPCIPIGTYRIHRRFRDAEYDLIIRQTGKGGKVFIPYKSGKQTLEVEV